LSSRRDGRDTKACPETEGVPAREQKPVKINGGTDGTKANVRRWCVMKKIVTITACLLALGAASIAADADGISWSPRTAEFAMSSPAAPVSVAAVASGEGVPGQHMQIMERDVRLVSGKIAPVRSCSSANWPYYPADCLQRTESAGL